jgi:hypothetical protein
LVMNVDIAGCGAVCGIITFLHHDCMYKCRVF